MWLCLLFPVRTYATNTIHYSSCLLCFFNFYFWSVLFLCFLSLSSLGIIPMRVTSVEMKCLEKMVFIAAYSILLLKFSYILHIKQEVSSNLTISIIYIILFIATKLIVLCILFTVLFFISNMKRKFKLFYTNIDLPSLFHWKSNVHLFCTVF